MPPTSRDIERFRYRTETFYLTDVCTIEKRVPGSGPIASEGEEWQILYSNVKCRLIQQNSNKRVDARTLAGLEILPEFYIIVVPQTIPLQIDYRVYFANKTFEIVQLEEFLTNEFWNSAILRWTGGRDNR